MISRRWFVAVIVLAGCGSEPLPENPVDGGVVVVPVQTDGGEAPDAGMFEVSLSSWTACTARDFQGNTVAAECTSAIVPLDWSQPTGAGIELFLKRIPATQPGNTSLWLLMGGPGGSGAGMEGLAHALRWRDPTVTMYLPDHRGTGLSTRLGCADQEAPSSPGGAAVTSEETAACAAALTAQWGDKVQHFSVRNAARDLGELIAAATQDDARVFVLGSSYGTYWAARYLQQFPTQPTGLIMDSVCSPGSCDLADFDLWNELAAKRLFEVCANDPVCSAKLGTDPWAQLETLHTQLKAGHCAPLQQGGLTPKTLKQIGFILMTQHGLQPALPALVYRALRCDAADVEALQPLVTSLLQGGGGAGFDFSHALSGVVTQSELVHDPVPSVAAAQAQFDSLLVASGVGLSVAMSHDEWPRYARDPGAQTMPPSDLPMLMLNGTLDPQTPLEVARPMGEFYAGQHQHFVEMPLATHGVITSSPRKTPGTMGTCGGSLLGAFMKEPTAPLDTSCTQDIKPLDFDSATLAQSLFGRASLWEN